MRERLTRLETLITAEEVNLGKLEQQKSTTEREIADSEKVLADLKTELAKLQETLEEKNKVVDQVKKTALKSSKVLDQALKEIALCVSAVEVKAGGSNNGILTLARPLLVFRTMKSRNWRLSARRCTGNVALRKSNCRCSKEDSGMSRCRRFVKINQYRSPLL